MKNIILFFNFIFKGVLFFKFSIFKNKIQKIKTEQKIKISQKIGKKTMTIAYCIEKMFIFVKNSILKTI